MITRCQTLLLLPSAAMASGVFAFDLGRAAVNALEKLNACVMLLLWSVCCASVVIGSAAAATPLPTDTVAHGPFEIVVGARRISAGSLDKGNVFATREVSEFQVRWRGKLVSAPGGNQRFWRVLRLAGAPRPAVLLVTQGFALATEDAAGQLQVAPINAASASLAELQWLDSVNGQPGASQTYGIEAVSDLQAGTQIAGGRWLRFGSRSVMDVATLKLFAVEPWVPMLPGVPVTSISREGDDVRAFSPGRTQYALATAACEPALRRLAVVIDAELATGRHDALIEHD